MTPSAGRIQIVRELITRARHIAVLTGAGISAESGIPTFRGPGGLWRDFRPEQLATQQAFARDPKTVWEWYDFRRQMIAAAEPNPGHHAFVTLQQRAPKFTLITQNVDGLHERAGSRGVLCLHGSIWNIRCSICGQEQEDFRVPLPELPPRCACGGLLRPGVVWFGEALPASTWLAAERAAQNADVFLVAGTSAVVYPAASLVPEALHRGAAVIEINMEETALSGGVHHSLRGPSGELLPRLLD